MKILIAEDDERLLELYRDFGLMDEKKSKIMIARTGKETLLLMTKEKPEILLLDMKLPDMDGIQILDQLHAKGLTKKTKIYGFTNLSDDEIRAKAMKLGVKKYVIKAEISYKSIKNLIEKGELEE